MNCQKMNAQLADLLLDPQSVPEEVRGHLEGCTGCRQELEELRATMGLMDEWAVPEVSPFFDAKLLARLRAEQQNGRASFLERVKARFLYSSNMRLQPVLASVLGVVMLAGGGTYANLEWSTMHSVQESATVRDLQSLDGNAQVFQQLDAVDQSADQPNQDSGATNGSPSSD